MTHLARSVAPVFIVGAPRSGAAWLYHLLLSAGGFAIHLAEPGVSRRPAAGDGDPPVPGAGAVREPWLRSTDAQQSGLDADLFRGIIAERCRTSGDLLRLLMDGVAEQQQVPRWADCTPENLLYVDAIKRNIPEALFLHIVRDGRDVACSLARQALARGHRSGSGAGHVLQAALYWEWMLRRGREQIRRCKGDAMEVRFEALVAQPRETLTSLGAFLSHDLDYDRIWHRGIGTVTEPNTAYPAATPDHLFRPVGRWQRELSVQRLARLESAVGGLLEDLGYPLYTDAAARGSVRTWVATRRALARSYLTGRHWLRTRTPLERLFTRRALRERLSAFDTARVNATSRKHTV